MIIQLLPDQIAKLWDYIKIALIESAPPNIGRTNAELNNILAALLSEKAQCWISFEKSKEGKRFEAVVITQIVRDALSDTKNLLIYSLYGEIISDRSWQQGMIGLAKFGLAKGCKNFVAFTDNPVVLQRVKQFGGSISSFIMVPF
jgi:hypothetical protein